MYSPNYIAGGLGAFGTIATFSDWTVAGLVAMGFAALAAAGMAAKRLRRGRS